mmetsp:Transcript_7210/g.17516  ORF Transcript_7210/g.17516 Transcript_7210/m.17516 type:complete len:80 (-) Transcript_7210:12-251(-)
MTAKVDGIGDDDGEDRGDGHVCVCVCAWVCESVERKGYTQGEATVDDEAVVGVLSPVAGEFWQCRTGVEVRGVPHAVHR